MLLDLAKDLESTKMTVNELKDRLGTQSSKISIQQTHITALNNKVSLLTRRLNQQNLANHELKKNLRKANQDATSNVLPISLTNTNKSKIWKIKQDNAEKYEEFVGKKGENAVGNINAANVSEFDSRRKEYNGNENSVENRRLVSNRVAFHVVNDLYEIMHLSINQPVPFETGLLNLGGQYHSSTSIFIAEQPGVYIFSVTILSFYDPHPEFHAAIVKNGGVLTRIYGHGDNGRHDQGSATVVVQLNARDEVWVRMQEVSDTSLFGERYTTFTGALLWD